MYKTISGSLLSLFIVVACGFQKVPVDVYYETFCPDSRSFITEVLRPQYPIFKDFIDIKFIPFGKSSINADGSNHKCHHGTEECVRNLLHGCVLERMPEGDRQMEFVACSMANKTSSGFKRCAIYNGADWEDVQECRFSRQAIEIAVANQEKTKKGTPGPLFVPTIVINKQYNDEDQNEMLTDPAAVFCKYVNNFPNNPCTKPQENYTN